MTERIVKNRKFLLTVMFMLWVLALLLPWEGLLGVKLIPGTVILTRRPILSAVILAMYFISIFLFEFHKPVFFVLGIVPFAILAYLEVNRFIFLGISSVKHVGFYSSISILAITFLIYIVTAFMSIFKTSNASYNYSK